MEIRQDVKRFVRENWLFDESGDLPDDASFFDEGILDSTGVLELVAFLEGHFGISVQDADLIPENFDSIQRITDFVSRQMAAPVNATLQGGPERLTLGLPAQESTLAGHPRREDR